MFTFPTPAKGLNLAEWESVPRLWHEAFQIQNVNSKLTYGIHEDFLPIFALPVSGFWKVLVSKSLT